MEGTQTAGTAAPTVTKPVPAAPAAAPASAETDRHLPSLIVTDDVPPSAIYRPALRDTQPAVAEKEVEMPAPAVKMPFFNTPQPIETAVTKKAVELARDLERLQGDTEAASKKLQQLQVKNDAGASEYYALVASINTELQSGTTLGNPILVNQWNIAQDKLNALSQDTGVLNAIATDLSNQASRGTYLLEATQNAFSLSGAVKEDHKKLTVVEDGVTQSIGTINRQLLKTNDEIARRVSYLRTERANLQALFLGITNGELYGQSLSNSLFKKAVGDSQTSLKQDSSSGNASSSNTVDASSARRPLVIIRFDRPNVNYDQPLYTAINQVLEKYPTAKFDLIAFSGTEGNPAQQALSSAEARKNGAAVLRSLSSMGLPLERVRLSAASSKDVLNSEVHIYLQ